MCVKKIVCVFLSVLILCQNIEFAIYFEYQLNKIHREIKFKIKAGVPEEELHQFIFTPGEIKGLVWMKSNEFQFHGAFYDVVRESIDSSGKTHFFCIRDDNEKKLFAQFSEMFRLNLNDFDPNHPLKIISSLLDDVYSFSAYKQIILQHLESLNDQTIFRFLNFKKKLYWEKKSRPPEFLA